MPDQSGKNKAELIKHMAFRSARENTSHIRSHLEQELCTIVVTESRDAVRRQHIRRLGQLGLEQHTHVQFTLHMEQVTHLLKTRRGEIELLITAKDIALNGDDYHECFQAPSRARTRSSCVELMDAADKVGLPYLLATESEELYPRHPKVISNGKYEKFDVIKMMMALGIKA